MQEVRIARDGRWEGEPFFARIHRSLPLVGMWASREYRIRYRQSSLGLAWSIVQPLALLATFGVVLSLVLRVETEGFPYVTFTYAGLVLWTFISNAVSLGVTSTMNAMPVMSKTYFAREVVPLAVVIASLVDLVIGGVLLALLAVVQGVGLSVTFIGALPIAGVLGIYVAAVAMFGGALTVFVRDLRHALPVLIQVVFFASPVMYPASLVPEQWRWVNAVNPVAVFVEAMRDAVLRHEWPNWPLLASHGVVAALLLLGAVAYTRSVEPRLVDVA